MQYIFKAFFALLVFAVIANIAAISDMVIQTKTPFFSIEPSIILSYLFELKTYTTPFSFANPIMNAAVFLSGMCAFYIFTFTASGKGSYRMRADYGSHGTARFQSPTELLFNYGNKNKLTKDAERDLPEGAKRDFKFGWFLGSLNAGTTFKLNGDGLYHSVHGELNMQMTVVGPPGSQKTTGFVLNNVFHIANMYALDQSKEHADLLITDPKSEIWALTSVKLQALGYDIHVLDFIHLKYGDTFNALDFIDTEKELMEIADGYIRAVDAATGGAKSGDGFWIEQEGQAMAALMGAVLQNFENPRFEHILHLLTDVFVNPDGSGALNPAIARRYFAQNVTGAPLQLWKNFLMLSKSETVVGNILGGLAGKLKLFSISEVRSLMGSTSLDIRKLGAEKEKPMAVFIMMPDNDLTFSPLINMVVTTVIKQLYKTAYRYNNKLKNPVYFILEEMANIGRITGLKECLGTMRGRRIYPMMIWQSLSQMKDRYKDGWEDILSQCDTNIVLGVNDNFTAKYISESLGDTTIQTTGESTASSAKGDMRKSESSSFTSRRLLKPDEITSMPNNKLLMMQRSRKPAMFYKSQHRYWRTEEQISIPQSIDNLPLLRILEHDDVNLFTTPSEILVISHANDIETKPFNDDGSELDDGYYLEDDDTSLSQMQLTETDEEDIIDRENNPFL